MFARRAFLPLTLLAAALALTAADGAEYAIVDLGTLGGADLTSAPGSAGLAINNGSVIAGYSVTNDDMRNVHALRWDGALTDLPPMMPMPHSQAFALNDMGATVGVSFMLGGLAPTGVRWMGGGMPMMLGPFTPRSVSNMGVIVGEMPIPPGYAAAHAVRWQNGVLTDLGTLGGEQSAAYAVAEDGRIVGLSRPANDGPPHAVLWQNGAIVDLGTLGGAISHAWDVNESGQIVGFAATGAGLHHAVLYEVAADGSVQSVRDLGELGGGFSYAHAINEAGVIVGTSDTRAARWMASSKTGPEDLNDLAGAAAAGWELMVATDVNDEGRITGYGKHDGYFRGFLLKARAPADLDGNGSVDALDFLLLLAAWGDCPAPCPPACVGDVNDDCTVDALDYLALIAQWGDY